MDEKLNQLYLGDVNIIEQILQALDTFYGNNPPVYIENIKYNLLRLDVYFKKFSDNPFGYQTQHFVDNLQEFSHTGLISNEAFAILKEISNKSSLLIKDKNNSEFIVLSNDIKIITYLLEYMQLHEFYTYYRNEILQVLQNFLPLIENHKNLNNDSLYSYFELVTSDYLNLTFFLDNKLELSYRRDILQNSIARELARDQYDLPEYLNRSSIKIGYDLYPSLDDLSDIISLPVKQIFHYSTFVGVTNFMNFYKSLSSQKLIQSIDESNPSKRYKKYNLNHYSSSIAKQFNHLKSQFKKPNEIESVTMAVKIDDADIAKSLSALSNIIESLSAIKGVKIELISIEKGSIVSDFKITFEDYVAKEEFKSALKASLDLLYKVKSKQIEIVDQQEENELRDLMKEIEYLLLKEEFGKKEKIVTENISKEKEKLELELLKKQNELAELQKLKLISDMICNQTLSVDEIEIDISEITMIKKRQNIIELGDIDEVIQ